MIPNFQLMQHQAAYINKVKELDYYYCAMEMGTGKSCANLQVLRHKCFKHNRVLRTLILCPLSVRINWRREIDMFTKIPKDSVHIIKDSGKKRESQLKIATNSDGIIIINYDALSNKTILELLHKWQPEFMICDEAHLLKSPKSIRSKEVLKLSEITRYKFLLSGSPIANSEMDIFMPYRILDGGKTFGKNYFTFRAEWMVGTKPIRTPRGLEFTKFSLNPDREIEFKTKMFNLMDKVTKEQCLDLPPMVKITREVEMSDEQQKAYNDLKKDLVAFIQQDHQEPRAVVAQMAITKALRLQQIVCGSVKDEDGNMIHFKNIPRLTELSNLIEELAPEHKIIVWSVFVADYEAIAKVCEKLGVGYLLLTGQQTATQKQESIDKFQTDKEHRVLIANQASGGVGLNLTAASYSLYYSKGHSLILDMQSNDRNYRNGSQIHKSITRIDLVATGTIDELIMESLSNKKELADSILNRDFLEKL